MMFGAVWIRTPGILVEALNMGDLCLFQGFKVRITQMMHYTADGGHLAPVDRLLIPDLQGFIDPRWCRFFHQQYHIFPFLYLIPSTQKPNSMHTYMPIYDIWHIMTLFVIYNINNLCLWIMYMHIFTDIFIKPFVLLQVGDQAKDISLSNHIIN